MRFCTTKVMCFRRRAAAKTLLQQHWAFQWEQKLNYSCISVYSEWWIPPVKYPYKTKRRNKQKSFASIEATANFFFFLYSTAGMYTFINCFRPELDIYLPVSGISPEAGSCQKHADNTVWATSITQSEKNIQGKRSHAYTHDKHTHMHKKTCLDQNTHKTFSAIHIAQQKVLTVYLIPPTHV